ncbi:uncharacterized protein MONOS_5922 [Monocercomonoides exilis]|uniref:uncharacterized protein n=1 Tax=Monocercomonoides exilis TaxID=2049356 RepID=UPI003559913C|nr:hypothetical protein MONOS_5922 [Monocercomonoides exilis]|eukprot:MONOS_5922.1-p1 / transcript=MONOS_5922.1 / gene=MONOS_5922 / organism=Monocercomonoides_exilis_PA203 / gene_product=unspecified product / transcript_product=unspecified product / location=Mono_scaffold00179:1558-1989(+) / protein_length=144 / sequence_SO=supercontig / SO=protein_coding / is_pseudo=false
MKATLLRRRRDSAVKGGIYANADSTFIFSNSTHVSSEQNCEPHQFASSLTASFVTTYVCCDIPSVELLRMLLSSEMRKSMVADHSNTFCCRVSWPAGLNGQDVMNVMGEKERGGLKSFWTTWTSEDAPKKFNSLNGFREVLFD